MNLGLDGKRALVLSSSRGLGLAVAESLAVEQANVVLTARDKMLLETAVAKISAAGRGRAHAVPGDLRHDAEEIWCTAQNLLGGVDILIANTGGPPARSALNVKIEEWEPQFETMVLPIMQLTAWALPGMRERHFGRIIVIGSTSIVQPIPNLVISTALRSAVAGWSKTLAAEVAKDGITVNMVLPGRIQTDRTAELDAANAKITGKSIGDITDAMLASIPAGRYGRPEEFADVVCFLASERASYVTGSMIRVDGGAVKGM